MVYPPRGYRFVHNLPNKRLSGGVICKILIAKEIICKIFKTLELWFLWSFGETQACCWWILSRPKFNYTWGVKAEGDLRGFGYLTPGVGAVPEPDPTHDDRTVMNGALKFVSGFCGWNGWCQRCTSHPSR